MLTRTGEEFGFARMLIYGLVDVKRVRRRKQ